jgi:hypothetical protein
MEDFYPTPKKLIEKMLEGVSLDSLSILEPSAGKGDICDWIKEKVRYGREFSPDVIEINPDLQATLKGKGYNLVHGDFLTFQSHKKYDLIVANFPFSEGDQHLSKAISILEQYGGGLVCLVNAETIKNPYTNLRKVLKIKLKEYKASIKYLQQEFTDAERKTDVEVALIKLEVPTPERVSLVLDNLKKAEKIEEVLNESKQVVETNFIKALIARFNLECKLGIKLIEEYKALVPYTLESIPKDEEAKKYNKSVIKLQIGNANDYDDNYINEYLKLVRHKYWQLLLSDDKFRTNYTSNILKKISEKLNALSQCDFTEWNIKELEKELNSQVNTGIDGAILDLFDHFSRKFSYGDDFNENLHYYNGWKTNKAHKINKKIIIPMNGFSSWGRTQIDYDIRERMRDVVKVFNYLTRENKQDTLNLVGHTIENANHNANFRNLDFFYFTATFYKKGTCHITFRDDELLQKFNIFGSQRKGWLPPSYGKRRYNDMTQEEKAVIDEFQGEADYQKVVENPQEYILENKQLLLT